MRGNGGNVRKNAQFGIVLNLESVRRSMSTSGFKSMEMPQPTVCLREYDELFQSAVEEDQSEEEASHASYRRTAFDPAARI